MAYPAFDVVRPMRPAAAGSSKAQRIAVLGALLLASVAALSVTFGQSGQQEPAASSRIQARLFEEPSISLGIREHEGLDTHPVAPAEALKAQSTSKGDEPKIAGSSSSKPVQSLATGDAEEASAGDYVDISHPTQDRFNYQLSSKSTWPPHDTADIPTGAYAKTYKGPYDPDYNWPDDTQVVRNDEWDNSGGVGCGMYGNSC